MPPRRKDWFPLWSRQFLEGSISVEPLESRGFYVCLCSLACNPINPGMIQKAPGMPYPHGELASRMFISIADFERLLAHHSAPGIDRVRETTQGILIVNWGKYKLKNEEITPEDRIAKDLKAQALTVNMAGKYPELAIPAAAKALDNRGNGALPFRVYDSKGVEVSPVAMPSNILSALYNPSFRDEVVKRMGYTLVWIDSVAE